MKIVKASQQHLSEMARLFDLYRQFYECPSDLDLATQFISDRMTNNESVIFMALDPDEQGANEAEGQGKGFVQLYPSFCSVDAVKIYILYDLYVDADGRKSGIGRRLMEQATLFAKESGAARLDLLTAHSNVGGQALYEKLGYKKVNEDFYAYSLQVK